MTEFERRGVGYVCNKILGYILHYMALVMQDTSYHLTKYVICAEVAPGLSRDSFSHGLLFQSRQLESETGTTEEHSLNKEARKWATRVAREHKNIIHSQRVRWVTTALQIFLQLLAVRKKSCCQHQGVICMGRLSRQSAFFILSCLGITSLTAAQLLWFVSVFCYCYINLKLQHLFRCK